MAVMQAIISEKGCGVYCSLSLYGRTVMKRKRETCANSIWNEAHISIMIVPCLSQHRSLRLSDTKIKTENPLINFGSGGILLIEGIY